MNQVSFQKEQKLSEQEIFLQNNYKKCPVHHMRQLQCISADTTSKYYLKCIDCISTKPSQSIIPLITLLENDPKTIFKSWPVIDDSQFYDNLLELSTRKSFVEDTQSKISTFFKQLRSQIDLVIQEKEDQMMQFTQKLKNINDQVIKQYNQLSVKEELKDLIFNKNDDFELQNQQIGQIISRVLHNQERNKLSIIDSINHLKSLENGFDIETPVKIKDNILQQIKDIDMFLIKNFEDIELTQQSQHFQKENLNEILPSQMTTSQLIMKLISNKFNNCSQGLLDQLNLIISKISGYLDKNNISEFIEDNLFSLDNVDKLNEEQLSQAKYFISTLTSLTREKLQLRATSNRNTNIEILIKLITNRLNNCSKEFIDSISNQFSKINLLLESFDFSNHQIDQNYSVVGDKLKNDQLQEIQQLIQVLEQQNCEFNNNIIDQNQDEKTKLINEFNQLFQNKSNFCNEKFINNCEAVGRKYPEVIRGLYLNKNKIFKGNFTQPIQFTHLDDSQLINISKLVDKITQLSIQFGDNYKKCQEPLLEQLKNSFKINKNIQNVDNRKELSKLFVDFPILELQNLRFLTQIKLEFIQTNFQQSQNLVLEQNQHGITIVKQPISLTGQIVTKNKLDLDTNYIFRLKVNKYLNQRSIAFGVMSKNNIDTQYLYQDKCCFLNSNANKYGLDNIIRGKNLNDVKSEINSVEVRVNLRKRILQFADYPQYKNVNSTNADRLKSDTEYYFGIYFDTPGDDYKIEIETLTTTNDDEFLNKFS